MKRFIPIAIAAISLYTPSALADMNYFFHGKYGTLTVDDPDGSVDDGDDFSWELRTTFDGNSRGSRTFVTFGSIDAEIDAGVNQIGQEIEGFRLGFGYERNFPLTSVFDVWLGASLNYSDLEFTNRQTIDGDGFLVNDFGSRDFSGIGATLHLDTYMDLSERFVLGVGAYADIPIESDGLESFGIRFTIGTR